MLLTTTPPPAPLISSGRVPLRLRLLLQGRGPGRVPSLGPVPADPRPAGPRGLCHRGGSCDPAAAVPLRGVLRRGDGGPRGQLRRRLLHDAHLQQRPARRPRRAAAAAVAGALRGRCCRRLTSSLPCPSRCRPDGAATLDQNARVCWAVCCCCRARARAHISPNPPSLAGGPSAAVNHERGNRARR